MAIGWQGSAAKATGWLGKEFGRQKGRKMVAETLSVSHKFKPEHEHGPGPEQSTSTTKRRSKHQSQCSARGPARATARARGFAPEAEGWEGNKEARSEGEGT